MISFIIPNWNRGDLLKSALASIRAQVLPPAEILVVDNGSTDESEQIARQAGAHVLRLGENHGFSYAVNRGIEAARGELLALANNDVEFAPDWTEKLSQRLQQSGRWFAIGKLLDFARRDRIDGAGDAVCLGGAAWRLGHGRADSSLFDTPRCTFFPSATAVLARRELFERAGKLDEAFFAYLEDVDLGLRAALLGLEGIYVPEAVAYHHGSSTIGAWSGRMVELLTRNQIFLLAKFYPPGLLWRFRRHILAAQVLWGAMAIRRGRPFAYLRGALAGAVQAAAIRRSSASCRNDGKRLADVLLRSEGELVRVQRATGWDGYWQWYFRLAPHPQEREP